MAIMYLRGVFHMSTRLSFALVALSLCLTAKSYPDEAQPEMIPMDISSIEPVEITPPEVVPVQQAVGPGAVVEKPFSPFTGKIKRNKVRMRALADLEARVIKELQRSDLLVVVGEKGDFYAVEPPTDTKAYVFRSFILDGVVEGNRVNVRLEPTLDAPVIGHLNSGDTIKGSISSLNNKWYEISPPAGTRFYVAKEFIDSIGGPEVKVQLEKRRISAEQLIDAAALLTQVEMKKPFREMDIERIRKNYQTVINDYTEFPQLCDKAKESLNALQEEHTQRKIAYLEEKSEGKMGDEEAKKSVKTEVVLNPTDRMKMWEPLEEAIYMAWATRNEDRSIDEFYAEQQENAVALSGIVEMYNSPVKRKPGDFIIKDKDLPVAYVYSTQVNLQDHVGKKVTLLAAPRSNNNFAFPAYYVLGIAE